MGKNEFQINANEDKNQKFLSLFISNQKRIFAFIQTLVLKRTDAEDIMQETIMAMWRMFDQFDPESNFAAWGMQIARYRILKFRAKQNRFAVKLSEEAFNRVIDNMENTLESRDERLEALEMCLHKLTESDAKLIKMCYEKGFSIKNTAEKLQRSVQGMYKVMARIHTMLQICIKRTMAAWEMES